MDDYVLESEHFGYYTKGAEFVIRTEEDEDLCIPDNLLLYTFEESNDTKFPKAKTGTTQVSGTDIKNHTHCFIIWSSIILYNSKSIFNCFVDYFVLDGASILPVLSLNLKQGDRMLDMCAAPGGKLLMAMQSLNPQIIVANDIQESRVNRINGFVNEFLGTMNVWDKRLFVTQNDARLIDEKDIYNKVFYLYFP